MTKKNEDAATETLADKIGKLKESVADKSIDEMNEVEVAEEMRKIHDEYDGPGNVSVNNERYNQLRKRILKLHQEKGN